MKGKVFFTEDRQTYRRTDGHCDSMTESAQWTDSVKRVVEKKVSREEVWSGLVWSGLGLGRFSWTERLVGIWGISAYKQLANHPYIEQSPF